MSARVRIISASVVVLLVLIVFVAASQSSSPPPSRFTSAPPGGVEGNLEPWLAQGQIQAYRATFPTASGQLFSAVVDTGSFVAITTKTFTSKGGHASGVYSGGGASYQIGEVSFVGAAGPVTIGHNATFGQGQAMKGLFGLAALPAPHTEGHLPGVLTQLGVGAVDLNFTKGVVRLYTAPPPPLPPRALRLPAVDTADANSYYWRHWNIAVDVLTVRTARGQLWVLATAPGGASLTVNGSAAGHVAMAPGRLAVSCDSGTTRSVFALAENGTSIDYDDTAAGDEVAQVTLQLPGGTAWTTTFRTPADYGRLPTTDITSVGSVVMGLGVGFMDKYDWRAVFAGDGSVLTLHAQ